MTSAAAAARGLARARNPFGVWAPPASRGRPGGRGGRRGTPEASSPRCSDFWHQDNSYLEEPARFTGLYATDEIPEGEGDTEFAHLASAFEALDVALREAARKLYAFHCHAYNCGTPHPQYPDSLGQLTLTFLIAIKVVTGHEALFLSPCYLRAPDVPVGPERDVAVELLEKLREHAQSAQFRFRHRWKPGDLLFWDNHTVMHRATTIDMSPNVKRVMFRMSFGD